MSETTLERIRTVLRNAQAQKIDEARETAEMDGMLGAMTMGEKAGEHKIAAQLLRELPEPECEAVRSYRAAEQLLDAGIDIDEEPRMGMDPERLLHKIAHRKRTEAIEAVIDRLEVEETEQGIIVSDPISKAKRRVATSKEFAGEMDIHKQTMAEEIIRR